MTDERRVDTARTGALLKHLLLRLLPGEGKRSPMPGVQIARYNHPQPVRNCVYKPLLGLIVQGKKTAFVGASSFKYGENQCMLVGVDLPCAFHISDATPEAPFLAVSIDLNQSLLSQLVLDLPAPPGNREHGHGVSVAAVDPDVQDAFLRLLELTGHPQHIPVLAPMLVREIHYRVLSGEQGDFMRSLHSAGTQSNLVARAILWMRDNYASPLHIEALAQQVHMAPSTFHHHFKAVTSLSPLQFYKRLRLYEAKRLMLEENHNAGNAGFAVGYESQAQFTREYKQLFGNTPHQDARQSRAV